MARAAAGATTKESRAPLAQEIRAATRVGRRRQRHLTAACHARFPRAAIPDGPAPAQTPNAPRARESRRGSAVGPLSGGCLQRRATRVFRAGAAFPAAPRASRRGTRRARAHTRQYKSIYSIPALGECGPSQQSTDKEQKRANPRGKRRRLRALTAPGPSNTRCSTLQR